MGFLGAGIIAASVPLLIYKRDFVIRYLLGPKDSRGGTVRDEPRKSHDQDEGADFAREPAAVEHVLSSRPSTDLTDSEVNSPSPETTPKSRRQTRDGDLIPSFTLDAGENDGVEGQATSDGIIETTQTPTATLPLPTHQISSPLMPPQARPSPTSKRKPPPPSQTLMPPPSRPPPKPSTTLVPPPSAASSLRVPPSRTTHHPSSLVPSTSTLPPPSRPSKKVLLPPNHSPLDWAHLTRHPPTPTSLRGSHVPPQLIRVPPSLLKHHNGRKGRDAWGVWQGKVYNLTPYLDFHPGGKGELMRGAGKVGAEKLFLEVHPWVNWEGMLGECLVGVLVDEGEEGGGEGYLEEMD